MNFQYTRHGLSPKDHQVQRFFEVIPGFLSWTAILGVALVSFWKPLVGAIIIIVFDFYWLLRLFHITIFLILAYCRLSIESQTNWGSRIKFLDERMQINSSKEIPRKAQDLKLRISEIIFRRRLTRLQQSHDLPPNSKNLIHLIIYPVFSEDKTILQAGLKSFIKSTFPAKQMLVVLAVEERAQEDVKKSAFELQETYKNHFFDFQVIVHPDHLSGESRVKGANVTYAAREVEQYLEKNKIPIENVIVSCFDADTVVSPEYFACLTYTFIISPDRYQASFQPIPVYHNNIWQATSFARILEMGASFFQLSEATNPEKLVTFSSHSMSFKALRDVNYWPVDMVSDDSAIFWKAFIHFDGNYRTIPMYITLSMDVAHASSIWKAAVTVYKQKRRWAWGVENFPMVMRAFLQAKKISFYNKFRYGFKLLEGHLAWATWPFLLGVVGWLPALFAGQEFSNSVVYYSAPRITGMIFSLATLSLVITILLSLSLLPKKKIRFSFWRRVLHAFEWFLIPPIAILFSGLPALDAQTRLMFGKYLDFWVTEKKREVPKRKNKT